MTGLLGSATARGRRGHVGRGAGSRARCSDGSRARTRHSRVGARSPDRWRARPRCNAAARSRGVRRGAPRRAVARRRASPRRARALPRPLRPENPARPTARPPPFDRTPSVVRPRAAIPDRPAWAESSANGARFEAPRPSALGRSAERRVFPHGSHANGRFERRWTPVACSFSCPPSWSS